MAGPKSRNHPIPRLEHRRTKCYFGSMDKAALTRFVKSRIAAAGFDSCGIARAEFLEEEAARFDRWLRLGKHGKMSYLEKWHDERLDPRRLVAGARSIISVMHNYYTTQQPVDPNAPRIARYARGKDYHWVLRKKLKRVLQELQELIGQVHGEIFVDSGPVLEKAWAARAGLGWQGKNTLLLGAECGSFYFLAELIVDIELEYDHPIQQACGSCRRCQDACPTGALSEPWILDARRCISYFTIEYHGELPVALRGSFNNWMFGCDICQDVCPYNRKSTPQGEPRFEPTQQLLGMTVDDWRNLTRPVYKRLFKDTAVTRNRYQGLRRNIRFLLGAPEPQPQNPVDEEQ